MSAIDWIRDAALLVSLVVVGAIWKNGILSYLDQKGKNLADKEDVKALTRSVEGVKSEYAERLQSIEFQNRRLEAAIEFQNSLKMAALDRRLAAHQEAFTLYWRMFTVFYQRTEAIQLGRECDVWWSRNCLYLEGAARQAFSNAVRDLIDHATMTERGRPEDAAEIRRTSESVKSLGRILAEGVRLPSLQGDEGRLEQVTWPDG